MRTLNELIPNKAALARSLHVTPNTVHRWVANNAVPPSKALEVSRTLHLTPAQILPYTQQTPSQSRIRPKRFSDLDVLEAAYNGRPYTLTPGLTEKAVQVTLGHWKDQLPALLFGLRAVRSGILTRDQLAEHLGIAYSTAKQLVNRYDAAPPKVCKPQTSVQRNVGRAPDAVQDVISGRKSAVQAARDHGLNLRTLHRKLKPALSPHSLNEITHWSRAFRAALAWEVANDGPKLVTEWCNSHENLPREPEIPAVPQNLKEAPARSLIIHLLLGNLDLEDVVRQRGGSETVWKDLITSQLAQIGVFETPSVHHKAAAAEILISQMAQKSRKRRKNGV